jgi:hypothetical protein
MTGTEGRAEDAEKIISRLFSAGVYISVIK